MQELWFLRFARHQDFWFLHSARCLMLIDIDMKFLEDIMNRFHVTERTRFCDGPGSKENNKCKRYGSCALHVD